MKFVIQRVNHASVKVDGNVVGKIDKGYMVLIGISENDTKEIADKINGEGKIRHLAENNGKTKSANFKSTKTSKNPFRDKIVTAALLSCRIGL